ncbi:hypothetical protein [Enterobacter asburiae]|uniref:hypothetical protein n=1 Tax=Enterobacter asburiae TaxID=61645 RepID=UPI0021CEE2F3|nr:hypothetical protein [Enterobacter asburiae]
MDESRNNMREEFESWLAPSWSRDTYLEDEGDVEYVDDWVQGAWVGWRASRAAIEIELPTENELHQKVCSGCASESLEMVEQAIRAAGIKVKE